MPRTSRRRSRRSRAGWRPSRPGPGRRRAGRRRVGACAEQAPRRLRGVPAAARVGEFPRAPALADISQDKLAAARGYYNQTVYRYNTVKQSFPAVLIAGPAPGSRKSASSSRPAPRPGERQLRNGMTLKEEIRVVGAALVDASRRTRRPARRDRRRPVCYPSGRRRDRRLHLRDLQRIGSSLWPLETAAKPVERSQYPRLFHVLETVCIAAGIDEAQPVLRDRRPGPERVRGRRHPRRRTVADPRPACSS